MPNPKDNTLHIQPTLEPPEPLINPASEAAPYPVGALPDIMRNAVHEFQSYGKQPMALVACSALAAASLCTQAHINVARDRALIGPTSLNMTVIARSGERKTSTDRRMSQPVRQWQESYLKERADDIKSQQAEIDAHEAEKAGLLAKIKSKAGKSDISGFKDQLKFLAKNSPPPPIIPCYFYEDCTPEALGQNLAEGWPSASVWSDEAGLVIGGHGMKEDSATRYLALLNRMWDGNTFERKRTTAKSFTIKGRRLTCSLMMQHEVLLRLSLGSNGISRGIGFMARYLFAHPVSTMGTRLYQEPPITTPKLDAWDNRLRHILDFEMPMDRKTFELSPRVIAMQPAAKQSWVSYFNSVEKELSADGEFTDVADFASKSGENAARIAGVFQLLNTQSFGDVTQETMEQALAIAGWHLLEAKRLFDSDIQSPAILDAIKLEGWILAQEGQVSPRDILHRGPNKLREKSVRDEALKLLQEKNRLFIEKIGGKDVIIVHPELTGGQA